MHAWRNKRTTESIKIYHLDHADLVDRRKTLAVSMRRKIVAADQLFPQTGAGNITIDNSFEEHARSLANYTSEGAELSAFARKILAGHRGILWVNSLLRTALRQGLSTKARESRGL